MQVHTIIADSAADAVAQIRAQLGPEAIVLNVRPLPAQGLARLWQGRRIEVLAYVPETPQAGANLASEPAAPTSLPVSPMASNIPEPAPAPNLGASSVGLATAPSINSPPQPGQWRVCPFLENSGLVPLQAARVIEELRMRHGDVPPPAFSRELELTAELLNRYWQRTATGSRLSGGAHVLVGPPGSGKTICLCKWLAQTILVEGGKAKVWRLDGRTANTAESLSVYGEILGAPVERQIPEDTSCVGDELLLIDLPGVSPLEPAALEHLAQQLQGLPNTQVHLVLNAAYELPILQQQLRAFAKLRPADLIFTHLDEEVRWGKLWNFVLGTNFSIRFLSAGQNIPGDWIEATAGQILARHFPRQKP